MTAPLDQFLDWVDPKGCHIVKLPDRIWILGGSYDPKNPTPLSLRDSFWRKTLNSPTNPNWLEQLEQPEDHDGWWAFSGYQDLLEFERDACYLARAIVLFSESPGAHAELGALALDEPILKRLLVVVQSQYLQEGHRESFLNLGPLERVRKQNGLCVVSASSNTELPEDDFNIIVETLNHWLPNIPHKSSFQKSNPTHTLLLLADIVDFLRVCKLEELQRVAEHFSIYPEKASLERALKLLAFFKLIRHELRGSEPFWTRSRKKENGAWVNYTAKCDKPSFDRSRFKLKCEEWVKSDPRRNSILERT
ncbi:MAG: retron St85 family effector protein [Gallionella sp.]|nr:retron St85 family effector protein [Gallionella sp.]MDD4959929.1 retron St85 family effector protein [Gallionella sp.]